MGVAYCENGKNLVGGDKISSNYVYIDILIQIS